MHVGFKKPSVTTVQNSAKSSSVSDVPEGFVSPRGIQETETAYVLPDGVNNGMPIPKKAFDEDGELDLRRLSGDQGAAYIRGLGIPLAVIPRGVN